MFTLSDQLAVAGFHGGLVDSSRVDGSVCDRSLSCSIHLAGGLTGCLQTTWSKPTWRFWQQVGVFGAPRVWSALSLWESSNTAPHNLVGQVTGAGRKCLTKDRLIKYVTFIIHNVSDSMKRFLYSQGTVIVLNVDSSYQDQLWTWIKCGLALNSFNLSLT